MAAAKMMLETAEKKRKEAMEKLDEIGKKQKSLGQINTQSFWTKHFLLKHYHKGREKVESG